MAVDFASKILRPSTFRLPLVKNHTSEVSNAGLTRTGPCRAARARALHAAAAAKWSKAQRALSPRPPGAKKKGLIL